MRLHSLVSTYFISQDLHLFNCIVDLGWNFGTFVILSQWRMNSISRVPRRGFISRNLRLTRQIHNLEEELGVQLLNRTKNQVSLTQEGVSFLVDAKRLVALSLESVTAVQRFSRGESGQLNLGYLFKFNFRLAADDIGDILSSVPRNGG